MILSILAVSVSVFLFAEAVFSAKSALSILLPSLSQSQSQSQSQEAARQDSIALAHRALDHDEDTRVVALAGL